MNIIKPVTEWKYIWNILGRLEYCFKDRRRKQKLFRLKQKLFRLFFSHVSSTMQKCFFGKGSNLKLFLYNVYFSYNNC